VTSKLKARLVCVGILVLAAALTSTAQAATPEFHCAAATTATCFIESRGGLHGTGANDNVFYVSGGNVKCTGSATVDGTQLKGTEAKTSRSVTVAPTYTGCKAFGVSASVKAEGCTFKFILIEGGIGTATTDIICPGGKSITVTPTGLSCTITTGAQTGRTGVPFSNSGVTHVAGSANISKISYTKSGTECPEGSGGGVNGLYQGTVTLGANEDNGGFKSTEVDLSVF
jgi:hypothetical protein